MSNDIAMQIYELEQQEEGAGLDKYLEILPRDYEGFLATVEAGGLESPFAPGRIRKVGEIRVLLTAEPEERTAKEMTLSLRFGAYEAEYPVCVYPSNIPVCPESVLETEELDDLAAAFLREGGNVFVTPRVSQETTE